MLASRDRTRYTVLGVEHAKAPKIWYRLHRAALPTAPSQGLDPPPDSLCSLGSAFFPFYFLRANDGNTRCVLRHEEWLGPVLEPPASCASPVKLARGRDRRAQRYPAIARLLYKRERRSTNSRPPASKSITTVPTSSTRIPSAAFVFCCFDGIVSCCNTTSSRENGNEHRHLQPHTHSYTLIHT